MKSNFLLICGLAHRAFHRMYGKNTVVSPLKNVLHVCRPYRYPSHSNFMQFVLATRAEVSPFWEKNVMNLRCVVDKLRNSREEWELQDTWVVCLKWGTIWWYVVCEQTLARTAEEMPSEPKQARVAEVNVGEDGTSGTRKKRFSRYEFWRHHRRSHPDGTQLQDMAHRARECLHR